MSRVTLTEEQKRIRKFEKRSELLADGLEKFMRKNRITQTEIASELGLGRNTIRKLLDENYDMKISVETMWRLFDLAGVRMVRNEQEEV